MAVKKIKYRAILRQNENCPIFTPNSISLTQISVIIVSFNAPCFLQVCLESVRDALKGLRGEIIVIDNASTDHNVEMIRQDFPEVELTANSENTGFSKAVNQGVKQARGEYILILNPDSVLPEDGLSKILAYAETQENLGAVGCRFIDGTGALLPECKRNFPGIRSAVSKLFGLNWGYYADHIDEGEVAQVEVLTGAFMLIRRELFNRMKGFDERFFMFGEDIDLSYRIHKEGFRNRYYGKVSMIHFKGESTVRDASYLKHFYGALEIFYLKHYRNTVLGRSALKLLVSGVVRFRSIMLPSERRSDEPLSGDLLLLDSRNLSFADIVRSFDIQSSQVRKRIVSRSGDFYIGSDDPSRSGVVQLMGGGRSEADPGIDGNNARRTGH